MVDMGIEASRADSGNQVNSSGLDEDAMILEDNQLRQDTFYTLYGKRFFDMSFAVILLPALFVPMLTIWLFIWFNGGKPIFNHTRIGKSGRLFQCYKFRTMRTDAEQALSEYLIKNPDAKNEWEATFKLSNDPRVTPIGRFLRKTSLDELPQIFNVLNGTMSFVGPRPVIEAELKKHGKWSSLYLASTPGITGPWQVDGRNLISYNDRVMANISYIKSYTFAIDLKLIFKTALVIFKQTGK